LIESPPETTEDFPKVSLFGIKVEGKGLGSLYAGRLGFDVVVIRGGW